jgi:hypothetical protein
VSSSRPAPGRRDLPPGRRRTTRGGCRAARCAIGAPAAGSGAPQRPRPTSPAGATARHALSVTRADCAPHRVSVVDAHRSSRRCDGRAGPDCPRSSPPHRLPERRPQHRVNTSQSPRRERASPDASLTAKVGVDSLDDRRGDLAHGKPAKLAMEIAVEDRSGLARGGRCPPGRSHREPRLQQLAHRTPTARHERTLATIAASSRSASPRLPRTVIDR